MATTPKFNGPLTKGIYVRSDILASDKCLHLKVGKPLFMKLRAELFKRELTIQETVTEFLRKFIEGDSRATSIIDSLNVRKAQQRIDGIKLANDVELTEQDKASLYSLIEDDIENE